MKISVIGDGNVGNALARGLEKAVHSVSVTGNDPAHVKDLAASGEVVILAVPFGAHEAVAETLGNAVDGKIVVDVSNPVSPQLTLAIGHTTSAAEELQKKLPGAKVVKAFNTVFARVMDSGQIKDAQLSTFVASDDVEGKAAVIELARGIGFDAIDAGPLGNARYLEPLAVLNMQLGYAPFGLGPDIGFKVVH